MWRFAAILLAVVACTDIAGPTPSRPNALEYCGYDATLCEEPSTLSEPQWWPCGTWVDTRLDANGVYHIQLREDPPCPEWTGLTWRGWT